MRKAVVPFSLVAASLLAGCPDHTISKVTTVQSGAVTKEIPVEADLDILFVIDNSASTADKQTVFAQNFPNFVAALDAFPGGRPNLHIGVTSSSVSIGNSDVAAFGMACVTGDDGELQNIARPMSGCSAAMGQPEMTGYYLSDIKNGSGSDRTVNYTDTLGTALSCIAQLGTSGCGFEAQLEGMKRALDGSNPHNAGFIRPGAYLAVIILTDEDDCSIKDSSIFNLGSAASGPGDFRCQPLYAYQCDQQISPSQPGTYTNCKPASGNQSPYLQDTTAYFNFLAGIKDPSQIVVATIAGDVTSTMVMTGPLTYPFAQTLALQPSCMATINGNEAIARPGVRLQDFTNQFGSRGLYSSVCQSDYSGALTQIGQLLFNAISPCLEGDLDTADTDPNNPGIQPQCTVADVLDSGGSNQVSTLIPTCPMTNATTPDPNGPRPCWWVASSPTTCMTPSMLSLNVVRTTPAATGTTEEVSCAVD